MHSLAAQSAGVVFRALVSFLLVLYLGRVLGTDAFGHYIATLNTAILALILIEAGWPTLLYREGASTDATPARMARLTAHAASSILIAAFALIGAALAWHAYGLAASLFCVSTVAGTNLVSARMRGSGRFVLDALWQAGGRSVSALAILVCVTWLGTRQLAPIFLAWGLSLIVLLLCVGQRWLALPRWRGLLASLTMAAPFLLFEGLNTILLKGDMAILGALDLPARQLSWYAACSRLTEAALLLFAPVTIVLLRQLRQSVTKPDWFDRLTRLAVAGALVIGGAALLASLLFAEPAMRWLFGAEFTAAGPLLPWIAAMLPFALANQVLFQSLLARGGEHRLTRLLALAAAALLLGLALGVRLDGVRGAAIAVLAVQALLFGYGYATRRIAIRASTAVLGNQAPGAN